MTTTTACSKCPNCSCALFNAAARPPTVRDVHAAQMKAVDAAKGLGVMTQRAFSVTEVALVLKALKAQASAQGREALDLAVRTFEGME